MSLWDSPNCVSRRNGKLSAGSSDYYAYVLGDDAECFHCSVQLLNKYPLSMRVNITFMYCSWIISMYSPSQVTPLTLANPLGHAASVRIRGPTFTLLSKKARLAYAQGIDGRNKSWRWDSGDWISPMPASVQQRARLAAGTLQVLTLKESLILPRTPFCFHFGNRMTSKDSRDWAIFSH